MTNESTAESVGGVPADMVPADPDPHGARMVDKPSPINEAFWQGVEWAQAGGAGEVPADMVLVPRVPTSEMLYAMAECDGYQREDRDHPMLTRWEDYWHMAIAAAPSQDEKDSRSGGAVSFSSGRDETVRTTVEVGVSAPSGKEQS